ncbi:helix-turn-helix transcriptional regulator [Allobranchiibius sp. GilTou38]|uniref:helix-turn-helix transcriptional regulator n=1 Tax=Allobranchiibius sp. GilTou38 TaxID=2815210 RepID=UPI001AA0E3FD|nr:helix-turn-helix transcriptional regulator [Allobranchiibius sp. GilTou38]MBO1768267.1 helix-turn-helix transcriptional regulator [Allobranchiibius sp. GilTou38]
MTGDDQQTRVSSAGEASTPDLTPSNMAVMAHPARWAMYSLLRGLGPMRASDVGASAGVREERAALRHLRAMESAGYVKPLNDHSSARFQRWEALPGGVVLDEAIGNSEYNDAALQQWATVYLASLTSNVRKWAGDEEDKWPAKWRDHVLVWDQWLHLSGPDEMEEFHNGLLELLNEWRRRSRDRSDQMDTAAMRQGLTPVYAAVQAVPLRWPQ